MEVYRSAKPRRARDLSGFGSSLAGGRWSSQGRLVVYTAGSPSLTILEKLVHLNLSRLPSDMCLTTIKVPDKASVTTVVEKDLPRGWSEFPGPWELREIGDEWLGKGRTLLLRVPSAVSPHESNCLINPAHKGMSEVKVVRVEPARIYARLA
ncbi:MAG: RES family NAD+ phosphorylase [Candidatus Eisenbacteria bacterium]